MMSLRGRWGENLNASHISSEFIVVITVRLSDWLQRKLDTSQESDY